jgi:hypothetical protein
VHAIDRGFVPAARELQDISGARKDVLLSDKNINATSRSALLREFSNACPKTNDETDELYARRFVAHTLNENFQIGVEELSRHANLSKDATLSDPYIFEPIARTHSWHFSATTRGREVNRLSATPADFRTKPLHEAFTYP